MDDAKKAVMDLFRGPLDLLGQAEAALKGKMLEYTREVQRRAAEERQRAEAAAQAERQRIAEEARKAEAAAAALRAEQAKAAAALQATTDDAERERLAGEAAARASEIARTDAQAQAQRESAMMVVASAPATAEPPKVKGLATTTTIDFEVENLHRLVLHVAEHPELIQLLTADSVKLRAYVRGLGTACNLPGVRVFERHGISARRG
jgi:hypothetical protein